MRRGVFLGSQRFSVSGNLTAGASPSADLKKLGVLCYLDVGKHGGWRQHVYITRYTPLIINRTWLTPPQPRSGPWRVLHQVRLEILPQQRTDV